MGFFLSGTIYYTLCKIFPLERVDEKDEHDYFGTFGYVSLPFVRSRPLSHPPTTAVKRRVQRIVADDGDSEPYLERDDPEVDQIKEALHKVESKEDTVGAIGVFPVRE